MKKHEQIFLKKKIIYYRTTIRTRNKINVILFRIIPREQNGFVKIGKFLFNVKIKKLN